MPHKYSKEMEELYREWIDKIPPLVFPPTWEITIIPPFAGAMVRFFVNEVGNKDPHVSVYLDVDNSLGYFGIDQNGKSKPYWEIYPGEEENNDTQRFALGDELEMLIAIRNSLQRRRPK